MKSSLAEAFEELGIYETNRTFLADVIVNDFCVID